ncbi:MAG: hypothetical protein FWH14_02865 [Oscillospiraceae bacterium]|nr:hypothetical protein [Oscillospiraceae bacterium]
MRKLVENPVFMTYEEMEKEFAGKWVLVTNCQPNPNHAFSSGFPVAVADRIFEGHKDGFYDKFRAPEYAPRTDYDFDYENTPGLTGIYDIINVEGKDLDNRI